MVENRHDANNFQKSLFDHPKKNYRILEQVIRQSEKAGYIWIQEQPQDTIEHLTYWLLRLRRFPFNIFSHDFARTFFQGATEKEMLKHLQEMVIHKNPFEYLKKYIWLSKEPK
jgi:hypothetical protein